MKPLNYLYLALISFASFSTYAGGSDLIYRNSFEPPSNENCTLSIDPGTSFSIALADLTAGDVLCLNDGKYTQALDVPSGLTVQAVHDGMAEIDGGGTLGEQWTGGLVQMKGQNSHIRGLRVHHAHNNSDACYIDGSNNTMSVMSCAHGGWHKHKKPLTIHGSEHLVENSWFFGKGRYVLECFKCRNVTIRHNVARWDITTELTPSEPNASFAIYNSSDITIENNISLDYAFSTQDMRFGADFYSPQNCTVWPEGNNNNHYLGNYSINHALGNLNRKGLRLEADCTSIDNVVKDFYVKDTDYGIVISSRETGLLLENCSFNAIAIADISGGGANANATCGGSADIGAKYINRIKVSNDLFPWEFEALIKRDMCATTERQSDWCLSNRSLSEYIFDNL
jgi:hypothetical protein